MRSAFAALVLLGSAVLMAAQPPKESAEGSPQGAPKEPPKKDLPKD